MRIFFSLLFTLIGLGLVLVNGSYLFSAESIPGSTATIHAGILTLLGMGLTGWAVEIGLKKPACNCKDNKED